jgi:hypothetical protein
MMGQVGAASVQSRRRNPTRKSDGRQRIRRGETSYNLAVEIFLLLGANYENPRQVRKPKIEMPSAVQFFCLPKAKSQYITCWDNGKVWLASLSLLIIRISTLQREDFFFKRNEKEGRKGKSLIRQLPKDQKESRVGKLKRARAGRGEAAKLN